MKATLALAVLVLAATSCTASAPPCPPIGYPAPPAPPKPAANPELTTGPNRPHHSLQSLLSSVEALDCKPNGLDPHAASTALSKLAEVLPLRAGLPNPSAQRVRQAADDTASHAAGAPSSDAIHAGLLAALQGLLAQPGPVEFRGAVSRLGRAVSAMQAEPDPVPRCQHALVAFRSATDAVFAGMNGQPPFADGHPDKPESQVVASMQVGVAPARASVTSLGNAGWQQAPDEAAHALRLFASMLKAADCAGKLGNELSTLSFQAERLTRSDALSFGQTRWIKDALSAALDALDKIEVNQPAAYVGSTALEEQAAAPRATPWSRAARQAVSNIDPDDLLGLQRAPVQDGFRATLDAFVRAAETTPACKTER